MTIARDSRIGRGYIAREGDTGSVVWATSRDALAVSKGAARVSVGGRPGQLVFSFGANAYRSGDALPQPFEVATLFPLKTQGSSPDYPTPTSFHPVTMVIGPYPYTVAVRSGLLLTTLAPAAGDDYIAFDGVPYVVGPPSTAIPNNTLVRTLTPGQTLTVQVQNTQNPFCNGEGYFTLYPQ